MKDFLIRIYAYFYNIYLGSKFLQFIGKYRLLTILFWIFVFDIILLLIAVLIISIKNIFNFI